MTDLNLATALWRRSSRSSANGDCVEVAVLMGRSSRVAAVRDSKDPGGPVLAVSHVAWSSFLVSDVVRGEHPLR